MVLADKEYVCPHCSTSQRLDIDLEREKDVRFRATRIVYSSRLEFSRLQVWTGCSPGQAQGPEACGNGARAWGDKACWIGCCRQTLCGAHLCDVSAPTPCYRRLCENTPKLRPREPRQMEVRQVHPPQPRPGLPGLSPPYLQLSSSRYHASGRAVGVRLSMGSLGASQQSMRPRCWSMSHSVDSCPRHPSGRSPLPGCPGCPGKAGEGGGCRA